MKIAKKKILKLNNNLPKSAFGKTFIPAVILNIDENKDKLSKLGFSENLEIGETLLPAPIGPTTRFNALGKEVPDKTKPKETRYREIEWCWEQWAGYGRTETVCDNRLVPYERWQRIFFAPPSIELTISQNKDGLITLTAPKSKFMKENESDAVHKINIFLEIFGVCEILDKNQVPLVKTTKSLNWTILPPGKRPWSEQKKFLKPLLDLITDKRSNPVLQSRLEDVNSLNPEFTAIGNQGFSGYVIFGFPKKNIYILESAFYGNAIYAFNDNWEDLSKKTKAEIIQGKLQIDRITHNGERTNWMERIKELLNNYGKDRNKK